MIKCKNYGIKSLWDNKLSMGSSAGIAGHSNVSCMLLSKAIAILMRRMSLLNDLYEFQSSVTKLEATEAGILGMAARGGTSIDNVIRKCKETGVNSCVITDAEDHMSEYIDNAIFVGVSGVTFSSFKSTEIGKKYIENQQCYAFDGNTLEMVTMK